MNRQDLKDYKYLKLRLSKKLEKYEEDFTRAIFNASVMAGVTLRVVKKSYAAPDHPEVMGIPETKYLKFFIFQVV